MQQVVRINPIRGLNRSVHIMNGSDNITQFPKFNSSNIPEFLRKIANDIEKNPDIATRILVCGQRSNRDTWHQACGKDFSSLDAVGILQWAQLEIWKHTL